MKTDQIKNYIRENPTTMLFVFIGILLAILWKLVVIFLLCWGGYLIYKKYYKGDNIQGDVEIIKPKKI